VYPTCVKIGVSDNVLLVKPSIVSIFSEKEQPFSLICTTVRCNVEGRKSRTGTAIQQKVYVFRLDVCFS